MNDELLPEEEALDAAGPSAADSREMANRHRRLWIATGVTFVTIVALWMFVLPSQLEGFRLAPADAGALSDVKTDLSAQAARFEESIKSSSALLDRIESQQVEQLQQEAVNASLSDLRERIEKAPAAASANETVAGAATAPITAPDQKKAP